jgi:hypothetical protein
VCPVHHSSVASHQICPKYQRPNTCVLTVSCRPASPPPCHPHTPHQDVANALWALATLQLRPSPELLAFSLIRLQSHFAALKPREVATSLWALSQLQAAVPSSWLQECLLRQVGRPRWQDTQVRHWVMCLTACAHLKQVSVDCGGDSGFRWAPVTLPVHLLAWGSGTLHKTLCC